MILGENMRDPVFLKIAEYVWEHRMIQQGDCVLAAVSGGADSVFLLYALKALSQELSCLVKVIHVEHGIRGESSLRDMEYVKQICQAEELPWRVEHVDAPAFAKASGTGIEEAARMLRYQVFDRVAREEGACRIAVAHHMDDNAETMLFHLARGTGLAGLAGIPPVRGKIIRPLLCISRDEIEDWLSENKISWCVDETNTDVSLSRNLIRAEVLPKLKEINASAVFHMAETAEMLRKTTEFLDHASEELCRDTSCEGTLAIEKLSGADQVVAEHLVYRTLHHVAGSTKDLTREHVKSVCALAHKQVGKQVDLPYDMVAERTYDAILIRRQTEEASVPGYQEACDAPENDASGIFLQIPGRTSLGRDCFIEAKIISYDGKEEKIPRNPYTKWFDYDKIKISLQIRGRKTGDYLQIGKNGGHKSIQDYMVNEKIPAKERDSVLLLADGSHIVWVIGRRISEAYKVTKETKRVLVLEVTCADSKGETI